MISEARIQSELEVAIEKVVEKAADSNLLPNDFFWPDTLIAAMSSAAFGILKASCEAQDFLREQDD